MVEWKKEQIPFTTGCSFFQLEKVEENMTIRYVAKQII
jgi:uncharacterized protein YcsI (UPF0317 family)